VSQKTIISARNQFREQLFSRQIIPTRNHFRHNTFLKCQVIFTQLFPRNKINIKHLALFCERGILWTCTFALFDIRVM